ESWLAVLQGRRTHLDECAAGAERTTGAECRGGRVRVTAGSFAATGHAAEPSNWRGGHPCAAATVRCPDQCLGARWRDGPDIRVTARRGRRHSRVRWDGVA